jgi:16S rRNA (guanine527-N7)-methyltransferase
MQALLRASGRDWRINQVERDVSLGNVAKAKVEALVERYALPETAFASLISLLGVLATDPHAPTTVRDPDRAADDHLADSLVALELDEVCASSAVADIGAGAGFPGLPLAIALPHAETALVDSNARKCGFIERAAAAAGIGTVTVINTRAEAWPAGVGRFDLVTVRALAPLAVVAEYAAPLLRIGGALVAWRGRRDADAELAASAAASELGLEIAEPLAVTPYPGAEHRHLHVLRKLSPTPSGFPRRPGVAAKRPLGTSR